MIFNANFQGIIAGFTLCTLSWTGLSTYFLGYWPVALTLKVSYILGYILVAVLGGFELSKTKPFKWNQAALYLAVNANLIAEFMCFFQLEVDAKEKAIFTIWFYVSLAAGAIAIILVYSLNLFKRERFSWLCTADVMVALGMALWVAGLSVFSAFKFGRLIIRDEIHVLFLFICYMFPSSGLIITVWTAARGLANQEPVDSETNALTASNASIAATAIYGTVDTMTKYRV